MENFNHSLPGIAQIGYCLCENIQPNIVLKHSSGIPVGVFTEITPVRFFGQPSYEAVEEYDNNGQSLILLRLRCFRSRFVYVRLFLR